ncbi:MAG TPA: flagellar hook capping FlgD N-terminal domain-containing protein [Terriglobales bacterium]|jgi:flagellar basal-body rod modification protein FlgD|nr:flagellar hook capping FlgD N-terminal domain-containing protein [Terriglobales bacterium]
MQINPFASAGAVANTSSSSSASSTSDPAQDTNNMFLTLLTAQLKNQSPLDPVDPMQFTTELVQFNMLDQLTQINSVLQQMSGTAPASGNSSPAVQGAN